MRIPELLVPASSLEVLQVAVIFGADAVYIGGEAFGLRAKAKNFSKEDMSEGVRFAHEHGVKVYVTANILAHNQDLEGVRKYFEELREIGPDALIISDPGVYQIAKEVCPEIERHISTQANNTNYGTYQFWYQMGAKRVVTARELSLEEIREIRSRIPEDMEIETFVYLIFRKMSVKQLSDRKRFQSGSMYSSVSMEVLCYGRKSSGRVFSGL